MSAVMKHEIEFPENNPAALCAAVEKAGGRSRSVHHSDPAASLPNAEGVAIEEAQAISILPSLDYPIVDVGAAAALQPMETTPHVNAPFRTNPAHHASIELALEFYRRRQDTIKARTKVMLQAQAALRRYFDGDKDAAAKAWQETIKDPGHELREIVQMYISMMEPTITEQARFEKEMIKAVKTLPIYAWAKDIKGLGDASLACVIGEASGNRNDTGEFYSVGDFKSVSALWKRMGLAVLNGHRQGNPGKGATAEDWVVEGYNRARRSVMWNVGNSLILSMGKFRPMYGEDIEANEEYTYLQKVFAMRARYEAQRLPHKSGEVIKKSATGKDSYTAHAAARAKRYTEKRMLRMLWAEWRRCMA